MSWQDFVTISPLVAGILTAVAILIVDLIRPGKSSVAVGVALTGLAITALCVGGMVLARTIDDPAFVEEVRLAARDLALQLIGPDAGTSIA